MLLLQVPAYLFQGLDLADQRRIHPAFGLLQGRKDPLRVGGGTYGCRVYAAGAAEFLLQLDRSGHAGIEAGNAYQDVDGGHFIKAADATKCILATLGLLRRAGDRPGTHRAQVIKLVDPDVIIAGGEGVRFGAALSDPFVETLKALSFKSSPEAILAWDDIGWT